MEDYLLDLSSRHHDRTPGKMISAATVARHHRSLQQLFRWLEHEEEITQSPFAKMSAPAVPEQPVPLLTSDENTPAFIGITLQDLNFEYPHLRAWLCSRRISPWIARRGTETSNGLGRRRWVIERSFAWLTGYRRLTLRYERSARLLTAFSPWPPRSPTARSSPGETSSQSCLLAVRPPSPEG